MMTNYMNHSRIRIAQHALKRDRRLAPRGEIRSF